MRRVVVPFVVLVASACSLTTSFDGFTGGDPRDGGSSSASSSSTSSGSGGVDGATALDAEVEAEAAAPSAYATAVLADHPVAYWRLGEKASTEAAVDEVGNAHPGNYQKADTLGLGSPGATSDGNTAVRFGPPSFLDFGDAFDFAGHVFSVELWLLQPQAITGFPRIISKEEFSPQQGWHFETSSTLKVSFGVHRDNADLFVGSQIPVPAGKYTQLVGTYDLANVRLYVDGKLVDTTASTLITLDTNARLTIGATPNHDSNYTGTIDEVSLYDVVLTLDQVAAHFAAATR